MKPLLLLDVDGVLNPYPLITNIGHRSPKVRSGEKPFEYQRHEMRPEMWVPSKPGARLPVLLAKDHGKLLLGLSKCYELVWATTWENEANRLISPILGLPVLPVLEWPSSAREWTLRPPQHLGTWKTKWVVRWLDEHRPGIPWCWVDDDVTKHDREWLRVHYGHSKKKPPEVPYWAFRIEVNHGLRRRDFDDLAAWGRDPWSWPTGIRTVSM